jgi:hypothetical protein
MGNPNLLANASTTTTTTVTLTLLPDASLGGGTKKPIPSQPPPHRAQPSDHASIQSLHHPPEKIPPVQQIPSSLGSTLRLKSGDQIARSFRDNDYHPPAAPSAMTATDIPESSVVSHASVKRRVVDRPFKTMEEQNERTTGEREIGISEFAPGGIPPMDVTIDRDDASMRQFEKNAPEASYEAKTSTTTTTRTRILIGVLTVIVFAAAMGLLVASLVIFSANATSDFGAQNRPRDDLSSKGADNLSSKSADKFDKIDKSGDGETGPRMEIKARGLEVKKYASSSSSTSSMLFGAYEGVRILRSLEENERSKTPPPGGGKNKSRAPAPSSSSMKGGEFTTKTGVDFLDGIVLEYDIIDYFGYDPDDERMTYDPHVCCCKTGFANLCGNSFSPSFSRDERGGGRGDESEYGFSYLLVRAPSSNVLGTAVDDATGRWKLQVYLNSKLLRAGLVDCYFSVTLFYSPPSGSRRSAFLLPSAMAAERTEMPTTPSPKTKNREEKSDRILEENSKKRFEWDESDPEESHGETEEFHGADDERDESAAKKTTDEDAETGLYYRAFDLSRWKGTIAASRLGAISASVVDLLIRIATFAESAPSVV